MSITLIAGWNDPVVWTGAVTSAKTLYDKYHNDGILVIGNHAPNGVGYENNVYGFAPDYIEPALDFPITGEYTLIIKTANVMTIETDDNTMLYLGVAAAGLIAAAVVVPMVLKNKMKMPKLF